MGEATKKAESKCLQGKDPEASLFGPQDRRKTRGLIILSILKAEVQSRAAERRLKSAEKQFAPLRPPSMQPGNSIDPAKRKITFTLEGSTNQVLEPGA